MTGKMINMVSLNTSSLSNKFCQSMAKKDLVCKDCYSNRLLKMYKTAEVAFTNNGKILSNSILPNEKLPYFNAHTVRFNAYGELINMNHLVNLMNTCRKNKHTNFTLWTKKSGLVWKYLRDYPKPKNLTLVYSSEKVNERGKLPLHFDKVFTVYSKDNKGKSFINCGDKPCFECMKCYDPKNRTVYINEVIK